MPFEFVRNDITKLRVDAIVNAANSSLLPGGGVCGAIFSAAGHANMAAACKRIGHCGVGQAVITGGYALPAKYVIHTVGPIWQGGKQNEAALLKCCYIASLRLAARYGCRSIAFPLISSGVYGYPKAEAMRIAVSAFQEFLVKHEMQIYLVLFDQKAVFLSETLQSDLRSYIDDHYVDTHLLERQLRTDSAAYRRQMEEQDAMASFLNFISLYSDFSFQEQKIPSFSVQPEATNTEPASTQAFEQESAKPSPDFGNTFSSLYFLWKQSSSYSGRQPGALRTSPPRETGEPVADNAWDESPSYRSASPSFPVSPAVNVPTAAAFQTVEAENLVNLPDDKSPLKTENLEDAISITSAASSKFVAEKPSLKDLLSRLDESFSRMLLRLIDEKGLTDVEVYKRAHIDRKLFSKIRRDGYNPSKQTAIALAVALRLDLNETQELLNRAGYSLSHSSKFDVIVEYFIKEGIYDIYKINEALYDYEQRLLA